MAGGKVDTKLSEWLLVILICASLFIEFLLHKLEHWINHRHQHLQAVVKVLYRELMILGFVSFIFVLYETFEKPEKDIIISFEFAHLLIFMLAVIYTFVVVVSMLTSLRLSARWKKMEQLDLVKYLHLKEQYNAFRTQIRKHHGGFWRWVLWWFPNFGKLYSYMQLHEVMAFHDIRFQFIYYRDLPEHFRFSSFLRKIKAITFVDLVESHWSLYAIFLLVVLADLLRRYTIGSPAKEGKTDVAESVFIISAAVLLSFFVQILAFKIRKIYWELTKNPRMYYEGVDPHVVQEELAAAQARFDEERARRRRTRSADGPTKDDLGEVADDEATDSTAAPANELPESEMLEPMHLQMNNQVKADQVTSGEPQPSPADDDAITPQIAQVNYRPSANRAAANRAQSNLVDTNTGDFELEDMASRHSLDYKVRAAANGGRSAGHSLEYARANRTPPLDVHLPMEMHETASRHSLEMTQNLRGGNLQQMSRKSRETFAASAAVEAARRRTAEGGFNSRQSTDMTQSPPPGQRLGDGPRPGDRPVADRRIGSPRIMSRLSSRGVSTDNDGRPSSNDYARGSLEGRARGSVELASVLPRDELAIRHHPIRPIRDIEAGVTDWNSGAEDSGRPLPPSERTGSRIKTGSTSMDDEGTSANHSLSTIARQKSVGLVNAAIVKNLEHHERAKNMEPAPYPKLILKLIPRLRRVASPVEKLFWFGSHHFFMWCVEFCLFSSTVVLAAASAAMAILGLAEKDITAWHIVSLVLAGINLAFVLFRIAGIIKKYIFILHNASLVDEKLAIETIHNVSKKSAARAKGDELLEPPSDLSGSESEPEEEQAALERRRTLGRFFRGEAESGNMPGIEAGGRGAKRISDVFQRSQRRKLAFRRRAERMQSGGEDIPVVPKGNGAENSLDRQV